MARNWIRGRLLALVIGGRRAVVDGVSGEFQGTGSDLVTYPVATIKGGCDGLEEFRYAQFDVIEIRARVMSAEELPQHG